MDIVVLVKQTMDVELNIRVKEGNLVQDGMNYVISNWDEIAVEAAIQLTESSGGEVTLVTIGPESAAEILRKGLAMGAHQAIHILDPGFQGSDSFVYAKALSHALKGRKFDIVLAGKQSQDNDAGLTAGMLAEFLTIPQVSNVVKILVTNPSTLEVHRKGDLGTEITEVQLPVVLTANDSLTTPRLASLRGIMQAKKKTIETLDLASLGLSAADVGSQGAQTKVLQFFEPEGRKAGKIFKGDEAETTKQVLDLLVNEAKVFA